MSTKRWAELGALAGLAGLSAVLNLLPLPQPLRYGAALLLLWVLPGLGWSAALRSLPSLERLVRSVALAFVSTGLITLALHFLPGPFPVGAAPWVYAAESVVVAAVAMLRRKTPASQGAAPASMLPLWTVLVVCIVAVVVRFPNLGYSEFQGDEALIMQRAAAALAGDETEFFLHQKGPAEILVPMSLWALSGTVSELQVRLPFAVMGMLAVLALALLSARWHGACAGWIAGLLMAISGLLVAFSRIVQYQSIVVAMGVLSLLAALDYEQDGHLGALLQMSALLAFGLLGHYDAVLVAPAVGWVLVRRWLAAPASRGAMLRHLLWAALLGLGILALFYVPYALDPMFSRTYAYLTAGRLGGGDSLLHNSLVPVWRMSQLYDALIYVVGGAVLAAVGLFLPSRHPEARLYLLVPFVFYVAIVADPRSHIYTFYPGAMVFAGRALATAWDVIRQRRRWLRYALVGTVLVWTLLSAGYPVLAFVSHDPEYKREWPESRSPLYPVTYPPDQLPPYGHFGFPYRAGWKVVEQLYASGILSGTYASNEEPEVTTWYVRSGTRTMCPRPDCYVVAVHVQDEIPVDWTELERDYRLAVEVLSSGAAKLSVYCRSVEGEPLVRWADDPETRTAFERATLVPAYEPDPTAWGSAVSAEVGQIGRLLGYTVSAPVVRRGEILRVVLYWQALSSPRYNYQVFTHLIEDGDLIAQHDGAPACTHNPTSQWEMGAIVRDEHDISIPANARTGKALLTTGMYNLVTLEPVAIAGQSSPAILLTEVEIVP